MDKLSISRLRTQLDYASLSANERQDCAVKAVAIVTGSDYKTAWDMLDLAGREARRGTYIHTTMRALDSMGYKHVSSLPRQPNGSQYTLKTICKAYPKGKYLVSVRGHIAAMIDGVVIDWAADTRCRVISIRRVTPIESVLPTNDSLDWL